jgi:hypothetical protein
MIMFRRTSLVLLSALFVALSPVATLADDFAPPPWDRSSPFAITAEWEFLTPANPAAPDGPLTNVGAKGSGSVLTSVDIFGPSGWGLSSPDFDDDGGWFFPPVTDPRGMRFRVDNVIDHEPIKHLWVQVTHSPGLTMFIDPMASFNLPATGSTPGPVLISVLSPINTLFQWDMFPNPPWEDFTLHVTGTGEIDQVVVDTISTGIPEPTTFVVYGLVLMAVGIAWRRFTGALS